MVVRGEKIEGLEELGLQAWNESRAADEVSDRPDKVSHYSGDLESLAR